MQTSLLLGRVIPQLRSLTSLPTGTTHESIMRGSDQIATLVAVVAVPMRWPLLSYHVHGCVDGACDLHKWTQKAVSDQWQAESGV